MKQILYQNKRFKTNARLKNRNEKKMMVWACLVTKIPHYTTIQKN
jgi:hypothetical protein